MNRRKFLKRTSLAVGAVAAAPELTIHAAEGKGVSIIVDPSDKIAASPPPRWAAGELRQTLEARAVHVRSFPRAQSAPSSDLCIVVVSGSGDMGREILRRRHSTAPTHAEEILLVQAQSDGRDVLLACGSDATALVYAVLELADRVRYADSPLAGLDIRQPITERPANVIRGIMRCFQSDVEDKPWFYDRAMWKEYLTMLATNRFNRFSLTLGLGYNAPSRIADSYLSFAYPFLLAVPGYDVKAGGLPDAERDRNLEMLRFIGEETVARGLQFQLGLWTHGYDWPESSSSNYPTVGLTRETHAPYCRDALAALLKECPAISGVTLRVHSESGIPDGSFPFWETLFEAIRDCDRPIELDMHAKNVPRETIRLALATGKRVTLSPKYWAEHMGLPYHQAAIRDLEMAAPGQVKPEPDLVSSGSRKFTRYGYADLLAEDRKFGVLHRVFPGARRTLLWADPAHAAGYGRLASFCGSRGVDLFEPLSFKGRRGSGIAGGRCAYADKSLDPRYDWEKYLHTYRVWGRLVYNPDAEPETWQRHLRKSLGKSAPAAEEALANASRILPLVTTAHGLSGDNGTYWPEMYTNMPVVDPHRPHPYGDTPSPKRFGTVSPFDPQLFARIDDCADDLLNGVAPTKYSPLEVAQWLENLAESAERNLRSATSSGLARTPEFRRLSVDVRIQRGLGLFFGAKLRSAVLWRLYEKSGDSSALAEALKAYRSARAAWASLAEEAKTIYAPDITYGQPPHMRGHWLDRLAAIDADIGDMEKGSPVTTDSDQKLIDWEHSRKAVQEVLRPASRPAIGCVHAAPERFEPGGKLELELSFERHAPEVARLRYRRVNQAERWQSLDMSKHRHALRAAIAGDYTQSRYPLQYYFEIEHGAGVALYPGFNADLSNLPYFVVRSRGPAA
jgi:hypothetical protein